METTLTIGKVAQQAKVNIQTIRYYERRGLVKPFGHRPSGYRLYTGEAVQKIRFIKHAQELGFTLKEISALLRLRVSKTARCEDVREKAHARLKNVKEKIHRLRSIETTLEELIQSCPSQRKTEKCPILRSMQAGQP